MNVANAIDIDFFSVIILLFIYANTTKNTEHTFVQHKLFIALTFILVSLLVSDGSARIVDGRPGDFYLYLNFAFNVLLFLLSPMIAALWLLYADYQVYHSEHRQRMMIWPLAAYLAINAIIDVATLFNGCYFTIDTANYYHRGPWALYNFLSCYAILFYSTVLICLNKKRIDKNHFFTLLVFAIPPAIGGVLQSVFYGLVLIGPGMTLSMLLIFINIQDKRLNTDYLTGTYNRRLLASYIEDKIKSTARGGTFSAILIDLDDFKLINDKLGHDVGDDALLDAVSLLKSCLRHGDIISRYGGDEFLIILDISCAVVLEDTVERLRGCFSKFNQNRTRPYNLGFSTGYAVYDRASCLDTEQFIRHVDKLMYEDKKRTNKSGESQ